MDDGFSRALDQWTAYYALMGGAAATLLGLLFVAVSLRLNIFRQREVEDVRDFAAFTLGTFLVAMVVAGLVLAPHEQQGFMSLALLVIGVADLSALTLIARVSIRLNRPPTASRPGFARGLWGGRSYLFLMVGPHVALIVATVLLWGSHPHALGWLAVVEAWLLASGTVAAWVLLSHAGRGGDGPPDASEPPSSPSS